jgi:site-specific DNA-methyltransferase (adenine-specific)/modification methylase
MLDPVKIGNATLYLGDCMDILPTLGKVDAVITDPPYGIGADKMTLGNGKRKIERGDMEWDSKPPSHELMDLIHSKGQIHVYWGGNYFGLPASKCWLVWDKCTGANSFADCELAWTNIDSVVRKITVPWVGASAKDESGERVHPTQKPLGVMRWSIEKCKPQPQTILDPFMGSGTTGVAAIQLGRSFIGIEREPKYFDIACKRIEQAVAQGQLFAPEMQPQTQESLL